MKYSNSRKLIINKQGVINDNTNQFDNDIGNKEEDMSVLKNGTTKYLVFKVLE